MLNFKRKCAALIMAAVLLNTMPVCAAASQTDAAIDAALYDIGETMWIINEYYVGDSVTIEELRQGALYGVTSMLDPYSYYLNPEELAADLDAMEGKMFGLGVQIQQLSEEEYVIARVFDNSPAAKAGLLKGDSIVSVNGAEAAGLYFDELFALIDDPLKPVTKLEVRRGGKIVTVSVQKAELIVNTVEVLKLSEALPSLGPASDDAAAVIAIYEFGTNTGKEFTKAISDVKAQGIKRVIIDLRGNPGGLLASVIEVCEAMVPEGVVFSTKDKAGKTEFYRSALKTQPFEKVVIMTDRNTASASELFSAAMKDAKAATLVGETTFGKGIVQSMLELGGGGAIQFTTEEYYSRNGSKIHGLGVAPNVDVALPEYIYETVRLDQNGNSPLLPGLKHNLQFLGYTVGEAGSHFDDTTMAAVTKFQTDHKLTSDGKLNFETMIALNNALFEGIGKKDPILHKAVEIVRQ